MASALRPQPFRGDQIAAAVVVLTTAVWLIDARLADSWGDFARFLLAGGAASYVLALAVLSEREDASPRPYQSALYLASIALWIIGLARLAQLLGADAPLGTAGSLVWITLLLLVLCAWFAAERNSSICTLVALVVFAIFCIAFVHWIADPDLGDVRGVLFVLAVAYVLGAVMQRDRRPDHGVSFVDAAGLATLAIAITFVLQLVLLILFGGVNLETSGAPLARPGAGWELVLLAAGFGLCAYSAIDRYRGPGYLGVANLLAFVVLSGDDGDLVGWPLFLLIAGCALLVVGLRPSRPLPPAPDAAAAPAETVALR